MVTVFDKPVGAEIDDLTKVTNYTLTLGSATSSSASLLRQSCYKIGKWVYVAYTLGVTTAITAGKYLTSTGQLPTPIIGSGYSSGNGVMNSYSSNSTRMSLMPDGRIYIGTDLPVANYTFSFIYATND